MNRHIQQCEESLSEFRERRRTEFTLKIVPEKYVRRAHLEAIKVLDRGGTVTEARRAYNAAFAIWVLPLVIRICWDIFIRWWDRTHPQSMGS